MCRPGRVNQPPPRTALQKGALCVTVTRPEVTSTVLPVTPLSPNPTVHPGCLMGEPPYSFLCTAQPSLYLRAMLPSWILAPQDVLEQKVWASYPSPLQCSAGLQPFQCSWVCCSSTYLNTYFPKQRYSLYCQWIPGECSLQHKPLILTKWMSRSLMKEPGTDWLVYLKGWLRIQPSFENTAIIFFLSKSLDWFPFNVSYVSWLLCFAEMIISLLCILHLLKTSCTPSASQKDLRVQRLPKSLGMWF